jgi:hypothetical protein
LSEFFSDLPIGQGRRKTGHIDNLRLQANASAYGIFQDIRMLHASAYGIFQDIRMLHFMGWGQFSKKSRRSEIFDERQKTTQLRHSNSIKQQRSTTGPGQKRGFLLLTSQSVHQITVGKSSGR